MTAEQRWRPNVGIVVLNHDNLVLWAKRADKEAWQFPQGGINPGEATIDAMYRELEEELGLQPQDVNVIAEARNWLKYNFIEPMQAEDGQYYVGQQQKWFLLRLLADDAAVTLDTCEKPEFTAWRWVEFWHPQHDIVAFKKPVYDTILEEFSAFIHKNKHTRLT